MHVNLNQKPSHNKIQKNVSKKIEFFLKEKKIKKFDIIENEIYINLFPE